MILGETQHFLLEKEGRDLFLSYDDEVLLQGCNDLLDFAVKLPILDIEQLHTHLPILEALNITKEEKEELESILSTHIIKGNHCFDGLGLDMEDDCDDGFGFGDPF